MLEGPGGLLSSSFSLVVRWRTYARMLYLIIGLPLGLFYAVFIFGAIILGVGLSPIGLGAFLHGPMLRVLISEMLYIWVPLIGGCVLVLVTRRLWRRPA